MESIVRDLINLFPELIKLLVEPRKTLVLKISSSDGLRPALTFFVATHLLNAGYIGILFRSVPLWQTVQISGVSLTVVSLLLSPISILIAWKLVGRKIPYYQGLIFTAYVWPIGTALHNFFYAAAIGAGKLDGYLGGNDAAIKASDSILIDGLEEISKLVYSSDVSKAIYYIGIIAVYLWSIICWDAFRKLLNATYIQTYAAFLINVILVIIISTPVFFFGFVMFLK